MIGATYSVHHYDEFTKTGNKNIFEDIIDSMILDGVAGMNDSFKSAISSLLPKEKRMAILSLLDKDLNLFKRIKSLISNEKISKIDHLKEVILMLREYVKVGEVEKKKFGEVMTDLNLVKHILSRIPDEDFKNPYKTFIDLANGTGVFPLVVIYRLMLGLKDWEPDDEKRYKHIVENQIFISEIQPKNMFLFLCLIDPYDEYDLNIYTGSSLENGFKKHMKEVWKKEYFDYSVGNPPFNQMIDMKFVRLSYEIADVTCIVHPSTWLLDEKGKQKKFTETKELIKDSLESIELFNGNKIFNIVLAIPCCITYIDNKKNTKGILCNDVINNISIKYDDIDDINKYSESIIYPKLKEKIKKLANLNNLNNNLKLNKNNNFSFYVNISQISGNVFTNCEDKMVKDDFYTMVIKDSIIESFPRMQPFGFNTKDEATNFLDYIKSDFARFCFSIYKTNKNAHRGELGIVPYLDFSKKWTDDKIKNDFKFTDEEFEFIKSKIPKYY